MIMYNTLMGVAAGLALILVPMLARKLFKGQPVAPEGWSLTFGVLGAILTFLGGLMAVTWPLNVNPPINIAFAEPTLLFGLLLIGASFFLWRHREAIMGLSDKNKRLADEAYLYIRRVLGPVSWVVFALGLIMASCTLAIFRFTLVGAAPAAEPISGLLSNYPAVENAFFGVLYGLSAVGALLAPWALRKPNSKLPAIVGTCWIAAGVIFLLFSAMNYYTHIGLLVNMLHDKNYRY